MKYWMTRPLEGKLVIAGKRWEDIVRAQQAGCPLLPLLFHRFQCSDDGRLPAWQTYAENSDGICSKIGGYSRSEYFWDGQGAFNYKLIERARRKLLDELRFRLTGAPNLPAFTLCADSTSPRTSIPRSVTQSLFYPLTYFSMA